MLNWPSLRDRRTRITKKAIEYADHGWPVAALAVPRGSSCPCGERHAKPHLASETVTSPKQAATIWSTGHEWDVALMCSEFDIVDLPTHYGAPLYNKLVTACPTMTVFKGRRWSFIVETGSFPRSMVAAAGGSLHTGADEWAAAAPSRLDGIGHLYWVVGPLNTLWQPFRRSDAVDQVFHGLG